VAGNSWHAIYGSGLWRTWASPGKRTCEDFEHSSISSTFLKESVCNQQAAIHLFDILFTGLIFPSGKQLFHTLWNDLSTIASYQKSSIG
jgi:hypothetical protein